MINIYEFIYNKHIKNPASVAEYVDLSLPSRTMWATKNIGAKNIYDPGDYYAWG